tara:strand:- start:421 stop:768 length:348 start_codon:yes stop_codon:yes gene_type:complete
MNNTTSIGLNLVSKNINTNTNDNISREQILNTVNKSMGRETTSSNFANNISNAIESVAKAQKDSAEITKAYELGKEQDLTKVVVNQQISKLAFQITLNVRNKVLSAYKDIMNMPV